MTNGLTSIKSPSHLGDFYGARTQQLQGRCPVDDDLTIGGDHRVQQGIHAGVTGPWMNQNHPILWWFCGEEFLSPQKGETAQVQ